MNIGYSIAKPTDKTLNEDAIYFSKNCIAVSDGAGGCGLFADKWSHYLIENLPKDLPIKTFDDFDSWIDSIWEKFYNEYEYKASLGDGIMLQKFYNEGACATLASAWFSEDRCTWISYGDSVVFHYNFKTKKLEHSFSKLNDFSLNPHLISCKDPLEKDFFNKGEFVLDADSIVFAASDALSFLIMMTYELSHKKLYEDELQLVLNSNTSNSVLLNIAQSMNLDFEADILGTLITSMISKSAYTEKLRSFISLGILDQDDYSLVFLNIS